MAVCLSLLAVLNSVTAATVSGELKQWHKVVLDFVGPNVSEAATTFQNHRLDVTFTHVATGTRRIVPGFFAADGNAGESSATGGSVWRVNFMPDQLGVWNYSVSYRIGTNVAISDSRLSGSSGGSMDGETGSFTVAASDKVGKDFRAATKGKLIYSGKSYPQWMGDGSTLITAACNSPEVFLEFNDFDGTPTTDRPYADHVADWQTGDPVWKSTKGKGIIGVVNYISGIGINSHYFLTMNIEGDGKQAFPYVNDSTASRFVFDVSKLAQWGVVFDHMMAKGVQIQFVLTECENQSWFESLDSSTFGDSRKLYYREMVARFGYLNAVTWNIGEENGWDRNTPFSAANTTPQRIAFAEHLQTLLSHPDNIAIHNGPSTNDDIFGVTGGGLVGQKAYHGISFQGNFGNSEHGHNRISKWRTDSANLGQPWIVMYDEPYGSGTTPNIDTLRKNSYWAAFTAGAAGVGYYGGGGTDLNIQNYRPIAPYWNTAIRAKDFFESHVKNANSMIPVDSLVTGVTTGWCLANAGTNYVVYLPSGGTPNLNLSAVTGTYTVKWYDPRNGGSLQDGSVTSVSGGATRSLGSAPNDTTNDWTIIVENNVVANTTPSITTTSLPATNPNSAYNKSLIASSGNAPFSWSVTSGSLPEGFTLSSTTGVISGATALAGIYNFTVQVVDGEGDLNQRALSITVNDISGFTNTAPVVNAGADANILLSGNATLSGTVTDDGLPGVPISIAWALVSGPGAVTFASSTSASTTASFSAVGTYVLRLTGNDSALSSSDEMTVIVSANPPPVAVTMVTGFNAVTVNNPSTTNVTLTSLTSNSVTYNSSKFIYGITERFYRTTGGTTQLWISGTSIPSDLAQQGSVLSKPLDVGSFANNNIWSVNPAAGGTSFPNIASLDGIPALTTVFSIPVTEVFVFERGGNDSGTIQAILVDGSLGPELPLNANGAPYSNTGIPVFSPGGNQNIFGFVFRSSLPIQGIRINAVGFDATSIFTLPSYASWAASNGVVGSQTGDDDLDGLSNMQEFVFGLLPNSPSSMNPIIVPLSSEGTFSYTRQNITPVDYSVWYSSNLEAGSWFEDAGAIQGSPVSAGNVDTVPVTLTPNLLDLPKLFIKVRAD